MCNSIQRNDGKDGGAEVEVPSGLGSCVVSVRQHLAHLGEVLSATSRSAKKPLIVQIIDCRHSTSFLGKQRRLFHAILPFHLSQDIATELCFPLPLHRLVAVSFSAAARSSASCAGSACAAQLQSAQQVPISIGGGVRWHSSSETKATNSSKSKCPITGTTGRDHSTLTASMESGASDAPSDHHPTLQNVPSMPIFGSFFRPFRSSAKSSRSITAFRSSRPTMPTTIIPSCDKRMAISIRFASPVRARARAVRLLC